MSEKAINDSISKIQDLIKADNFIGKPIETEDKLLIPFMKVGFGFAGVDGNDESNNGEAFGAGVGIEPISIVVINKKPEDSDLVQVLSLSEIDNSSKIITDLGLVLTDLIKEILTNFKYDTSNSNINETNE
ncbi:MAG: hypothetical protein LBV42_03455 [Methanobrevibacter sp.]|jgi:uncharacterized spore protein YtfJ|nr:hypothetical protein [Methanobrevibacter sp.]